MRTSSPWPSLHPGAKPYSDALSDTLTRALAAKGEGYVPRTHHLDGDGRPRYINRLMTETSPYLLQHAHNPVDWFPWGEEAFERARTLNRPVLLSVGYSTCHWCHVMERESFEDEEIAETMNRLYVPVKVDREVRPDVDHIYMQAVQAMTGRGGWPMTVFLTPEGEPFYGGTYFPPRAGMRGMGIGFIELLRQISEVFQRDPSRVAQSAAELVEAIKRGARPARGEAIPPVAIVGEAWAQIASNYDPRYGGFGPAPKFPMPPTLGLGLVQHHINGDDDALAAIVHTLTSMAGGGIYDHLAGGFHRYSTDASWLAPHFEKMLYDQGLLIPLYIHGWQLTRDPLFKAVVEESLGYLLREMRAPSGAFYAATDADSEGEEGTFFVWQPEELDHILTPDEAAAAKAFYDVTSHGNWEGKSILRRAEDEARIATRLGLTIEALRDRVASAKTKLYEARRLREAPHLDSKEIVAWSAMVARALTLGGTVFGDAAWLTAAIEAVEASMPEGGIASRLVGDGATGFLEDSAFLVAACVDLFEATAQPTWLKRAIQLQGAVDEAFGGAGGGYHRTPEGAEALLVRDQPFFDGVIPSANAVTADNLLRLHAITDDSRWLERAEGVLKAASPYMQRAPRGLPAMVASLARYQLGPSQIVAVTPEGGHDGGLVGVLRSKFLPLTSVIVVSESQIPALVEIAPIFEAKRALGGEATVYICKGMVCEAPIRSVEALEAALG